MEFGESINCKGCGCWFSPKKTNRAMKYCSNDCREATCRIHSRYGINHKQWKKMFYAQGGKCGICMSGEKKLYVDHCHQSGDVRGLICQQCNSGIAWFKDNPKFLMRAARYVSCQKKAQA